MSDAVKSEELVHKRVLGRGGGREETKDTMRHVNNVFQYRVGLTRRSD